MKGCNYIKGLIDEADKPDQFPFEVNEHLAGCGDCERFAGERAALRKLVAAGHRAIAPMNFDAMLNARLAEVKARRSFSWLSAPGYLRLGAATAGLIVMIFAAQYTGLFGSHRETAVGMRTGTETPLIVPPPGRESAATQLSQATAVGALPSIRDSAVQRVPRTRQNGAGGRNRVAPDGYFAAEDGGVVLVRGQNGGVDVPMPTVSMGAQPLLYVSAGQRAVRNVGTSF
jgi:hypothetical protein